MNIKMYCRLVIISSITFFAVACSDGGSDAATIVGEKTSPAKPETSTGVIPQHQINALNRAKNTEGMILDADEERRKQLGID